MNATTQNPKRQIVLDAIRHLDHVLPGQAPIHDFVHHNTLHGFQHLPFEQALKEFTALTGIDCYLPEAQFRQYYAQGRITDADLDAALSQYFAESEPAEEGDSPDTAPTRRQLRRQAMLSDLSPLNPAQLAWQLQESDLLQQPDSRALWDTVLDKLELAQTDVHPEQLLDLSREQAESWLNDAGASPQSACKDLELSAVRGLFDQVGTGLSLRGLLMALTGTDILESVRPRLIKFCGSLLDEGLAAWRLPQRQTLDFYQAWLQTLPHDAEALFQDLSDWPLLVDNLPDEAGEAIIQQLEMAGIPEERWAGYLERLALELPGWAGLINWRQNHPNYRTDEAGRPQLADYLAIRLILDNAYLQALCKSMWRCPAHFGKLQGYFLKNSAELLVRQAVFDGRLPEYLQQAAQGLVGDNPRDGHRWQVLAQRIHTWQHSPLANLQLLTHGWRLFVLCRDLRLSAETVCRLTKTQLLDWLALIDEFSGDRRQQVWLDAYERHYREDLLHALHANHNRGRWLRRDQRPRAQIYFCMDEREESFRRHLEEINPAVETLGVAGFFGIAMQYRGLDAHHAVPLCPVVVAPAHRIDEIARPGQEKQLAARRAGLGRADRLSYQLYQTLRRNPVWAYPLQYVLAPIQLLRLLGKSFWPTRQRLLEQAWQSWLVPPVATQLRVNADQPAAPASPAAPRLGFTDPEQADRVAQFLRTTGLTQGFAPIVALMGHGSTSQNNPHEAAHDCGACGGRQGGPNARAFAAMANRPEVRRLLREQGIAIPDDTWFVGAQHDTCSDIITWFDLDRIPDARQAEFAAFKADVAEARGLAAAERCRRFASSAYPKTAGAAIGHVENRAMDLSQVRPEFGHATNAAAFIGRRAATQGAFFDRRLFLISYDPSEDADGTILENILLTAGPVGAGINLEYYFSSVNNEKLGCGTKIPHNVTGLFGVMEGAGSDLRTGLPLQMVEIHEAMRLQIVVEAETAVLEQIHARQPALRELIDGGWVQLSAKDPGNERIFVFQRGSGFVRWQPRNEPPPLRDASADCYRDAVEAVPPMLIKQPPVGASRR